MTGQQRRVEHVSIPYIEQLAERLSPRDWAILETLDRVRLATGIQLERLHFFSLSSARSRAVMRWRVLKRLVDARLLIPLDRRVGTSSHGSTELKFVLDSAGQRLIRMKRSRDDPGSPVRRPRSVGERLKDHTLAVTDLYVGLIERSRTGHFTVGAFQTEGDAYWRKKQGGLLKMDAFIRLDLSPAAVDCWWYEAELAIKSEPAIWAKLRVYLDFLLSGQLGPYGVSPRVFIGVENGRQQEHIQSVVDGFGSDGEKWFRVAALPEVADCMVTELFNGEKDPPLGGTECRTGR